MAEMKTYTGGCHCGAVRFEVDVEIEQGLACNCSICSKRGLLLAFADAASFRPLSGEDALVDYRFHKHKVAHLFCKTCGVEAFGRGERPSDGAGVVALNLRCFDDLDLDSLPVRKFNGAAL